MKKLIVMLGVCAMACASQAMAFKWSASGIREPSADNPKVSQTGIVTDTSDPKFAAEALTLSLFWVDKSGTEQILESIKNTSEGALAAHEVFTDSDTVFSTIIDDNGGENVQFVMRANYKTADGSYDFYQTMNKDISGLKDNNVSAIFAMSNGSWNYTANSVPEPTSGLLLLLGVAGLALRRRRA